MSLIIIILAALCVGHFAYWAIESLTTKAQWNPKVERIFKPFLLQLIVGITWMGIYFAHNDFTHFLLYAGFSLCLIIILWTDMLESTISDLVIIAGSIFCLSLRSYLGQGIDAVVGGLLAAFTVGVIFFIGNHFYKGNANELDIPSDKSVAPVTAPAAPAVTFAVCIHSLLPGGLAHSFYLLIYVIADYPAIQLLLFAVSSVTLFLIWRNRPKQAIPETEEKTADEMPAVGDGDITLFILIGIVFGSKAFLAIFIMTMFIHASFGAAFLLFQARGKTSKHR